MSTIKKTYDKIKVIGLNKEEILETLGVNTNPFEDDCWVYPMKKNWLSRKEYLTIHFDQNQIAEAQFTLQSLKKFKKK